VKQQTAPQGTIAMAGTIKLKRAYEAPEPADGVRILVDRLWPRGVSKDDAALDEWNKDVAPSTELRRWFGHDPARWTEFGRRYADELSDKQEQLKTLRALARKNTVTLVYGAHDQMHNQAVVLRNVLLKKAPTAAVRNKSEVTKQST
jgi:uncharacterized protein YeaO (DUF488 family)